MDISWSTTALCTLLVCIIFLIIQTVSRPRVHLPLFNNLTPPPQATAVRLPKPHSERYNIKSLHIHPIKSCRGISLQSTRLLTTGFDLDRHWMLATIEPTDPKDPSSPPYRKFLTLRQEPRMSLIQTSLTPDDNLVITIPEEEAPLNLTTPAHPSLEWLQKHTSLVSTARIWSDTTDAWEYGSTFNNTLSTFPNRDVVLLYKGPTTRPLKGNAAPALLGREQGIAFADQSPVSVVNEKSLFDLNHRLMARGGRAISVEHFRPNIVVDADEGLVAWEEDTWKTLKIHRARNGDMGTEGVVFDVTSRSLRCQIPNVDVETGVKDKEEPWNTLVKFRCVDGGSRFKPAFGMYCAGRGEGMVKVGDKVEVVEVTGAHRVVK